MGWTPSEGCKEERDRIGLLKGSLVLLWQGCRGGETEQGGPEAREGGSDRVVTGIEAVCEVVKSISSGVDMGCGTEEDKKSQPEQLSHQERLHFLTG